MAAKKKEDEEVMTPGQQAMAYLKANKDDHFNFEETITYKVPSSSLLLNSLIGGGISPGAFRFVGVSGGGKTSCVLDFLFHFLKEDNRYGVYCKTEGRLSQNVINRSGVKFTNNPEEWKPGTCFVLESNVYETVFGFIGDHIRNNPSGAKFFFIVDSMDMMGKKDDLAKALTEASQVAGGALITSVFMKKTSAALSKRGHIAAFLSQVREEIKLNAYAPASTPRQGKSSGGHSVEHAADFVFNFQPRFGDDIIRDGVDRNSKPIGHYCKIRLEKSDNEKTLQEVRYPICYGRENAQSVWKEKEVADLMVAWSLLSRPSGKGSWYSLSDNIFAEMQKIDPEVPDKFQGTDAFNSYLQQHPSVVEFLAGKFSDSI